MRADADLPARVEFAETSEHERETAELGMWIFLATEVLFFGGLFLAYAFIRSGFPEAVENGSRQTLLVAGTANTAILLLSSFFMALAGHFAAARERLLTFSLLLLTALCAAAFLTIKGFEYAHEIREGLLPGPAFAPSGAHSAGVELFFFLYFAITGLHGIHVAIGLGLILLYAAGVLLTRDPGRWIHRVPMLGLYWHFVDVVWIFVFPLIYLAGRNS